MNESKQANDHRPPTVSRIQNFAEFIKSEIFFCFVRVPLTCIILHYDSPTTTYMCINYKKYEKLYYIIQK